jgi:phosphoenolpyruvate carboxykinase (ATP)
MQTHGTALSQLSLETQGIYNVNAIYWNLSTSQLYEEAIRRREGRIAHLGA